MIGDLCFFKRFKDVCTIRLLFYRFSLGVFLIILILTLKIVLTWFLVCLFLWLAHSFQILVRYFDLSLLSFSISYILSVLIFLLISRCDVSHCFYFAAFFHAPILILQTRYCFKSGAFCSLCYLCSLVLYNYCFGVQQPSYCVFMASFGYLW